jgi:hypothetical protein
MAEIVLDDVRVGPLWVVLAVVAVALCVLGVVMVLHARSHERRRTAVLREVFGAEYTYAVAGRRRRPRAEAELIARLRRRDDVDLRDLATSESARVESAWDATAALFVESPAGALHEADVLVGEVMRDRGYPVERFDDRADLISLDHPELAVQLRSAHRVAVLADQGDITGTEQMRRALVCYRRVLDGLLSPHDAPQVGG